ncbi:hypothetical protein D9M71_476970 [compost metagenome]
MPGLALDQVTQHIVGHPPAQAAEQLVVTADRLIEHQRHFIMEARTGRADLEGQRIDIRPMQERLAQAGVEGIGIDIADLAVLRPAGGQHHALRRHHEQLGEVARLAELVRQQTVVEPGEVARQPIGQLRQPGPVGAGPVLQQTHSRLRDALEDLFHLGQRVTIQPAGPAHGQLAGSPQPRQPAPLGGRQRHAFALK